MPSGKQILLSLLQDYSQRRLTIAEAEVASDRLRAGLLLHGSTPEHAWARAERMAWIDVEEGGAQGLGLKAENLLLTDLFEEMIDEAMPTRVKERFPGLSEEAYADAQSVMWLLLSQLQYFDGLSSVENGGALDPSMSERMVAACQRKLARFRASPREFLGLSEDSDQV